MRFLDAMSRSHAEQLGVGRGEVGTARQRAKSLGVSRTLMKRLEARAGLRGDARHDAPIDRRVDARRFGDGQAQVEPRAVVFHEPHERIEHCRRRTRRRLSASLTHFLRCAH